ncbi:hypothetical protein Tco_0519787 [Tanacetum coccineum]
MENALEDMAASSDSLCVAAISITIIKFAKKERLAVQVQEKWINNAITSLKADALLRETPRFHSVGPERGWGGAFAWMLWMKFGNKQIREAHEKLIWFAVAAAAKEKQDEANNLVPQNMT